MDEAAKNNESPAWQTDEFRIYEYKVRAMGTNRYTWQPGFGSQICEQL